MKHFSNSFFTESTRVDILNVAIFCSAVNKIRWGPDSYFKGEVDVVGKWGRPDSEKDKPMNEQTLLQANLVNIR
jgi:hypothetical protein